MEKEYYYGYLRYPNEVINNGFEGRKFLKTVLEKENDSFKCYIGNANFYVVNPFDVIDWNKVFEAQSFLVGSVGEKITKEEAEMFLKNKTDDEIIKYVEEYQKIADQTLVNTFKGHIEYMEEVKRFKKEFGQN